MGTKAVLRERNVGPYATQWSQEDLASPLEGILVFVPAIYTQFHAKKKTLKPGI